MSKPAYGDLNDRPIEYYREIPSFRMTEGLSVEEQPHGNNEVSASLVMRSATATSSQQLPNRFRRRLPGTFGGVSKQRGRVMITGGAGFIGSHLLDRLLATTQDEIVVFDNLKTGTLENILQHRSDGRLIFVRADVRDATALARAMIGASLVYHLAGYTFPTETASQSDYAFSTNVGGTVGIVRLAAQLHVERVIVASSCEVYGQPINFPVDETDPLMPINSYGAGQVAAEAYVRSLSRELDIEVQILRLSNVYGPRDHGGVGRLFDRAREGADIPVFGDDRVVDFLSVSRAVDAIIAAGSATSKLPPINIASGKGTSVMDVVERIRSLAPESGPIRRLPARHTDVQRFIASVERMRVLLGVEPPHDPLENLASLREVSAPVLA